MKRNYQTIEELDGSVTVVSHGPLSGVSRLFRTGVAAIFLLGAAGCLFTGQWGSAGVSLLVGAFVMPKRR